MKFICLECDLWNMDATVARIHKQSHPGHEIKDTLGRVRFSPKVTCI